MIVSKMNDADASTPLMRELIDRLEDSGLNVQFDRSLGSEPSDLLIVEDSAGPIDPPKRLSCNESLLARWCEEFPDDASTHEHFDDGLDYLAMLVFDSYARHDTFADEGQRTSQGVTRMWIAPAEDNSALEFVTNDIEPTEPTPQTHGFYEWE